MKKTLPCLIWFVLMMTLCACGQTAYRVPSTFSSTTAHVPASTTTPATAASHDAALDAYNMFLSGNIPAHDPRRALRADETFRIQDISCQPPQTTQFALFDMNADALPELHLRPITDGLYAILTYKDERVTLWYLDTAYNAPLNDGSLRYERSGGAPPHTNYMHKTLDADGNILFEVDFSQYNSIDEKGDIISTLYLYDGKEVAEASWHILTQPYLCIASDQIKWHLLEGP